MTLNPENFSKLSKAELLRLITFADRQVEAYDDHKLDRYCPHAGQSAFHKSDKKIRLLCTGNRFGKTHASVLEAIWIALGLHPYKKILTPNRGKMYGESFPVIMESLYPKFLEWIPKSSLALKKPFTFNQMGYLTGVNFANGSQIRIGSYDQEVGKAEGSNWHYVAFDEPPSRELYIANMRGLVDFGGYMWFSMTPLKEAWIFDELWQPGLLGEKEYIECFSGCSDDNPYIDKESLKLFISELTDRERETRYLGKFAKLIGLVIDTYNPEVSDIEPFELNEDFAIFEGIDPHTSKPHCVLWKAVDKNGYRYACSELKFDRGVYDLGIAIAERRRELTAHGAKIVRSVTDTSINTDDMNKVNQYKTLKEALIDSGEQVMPKLAKKKDWVLPGIEKLRDLFRVLDYGGFKSPSEFLFKNRVPNYRYDLLHYQWPDDISGGNENPKKAHDDFIDPSRYIERLAPEFTTPGSSSFLRTYNGAYTRRA